MDPERWARIESLYHAALAKEPGARSEYLATACEQEPDLRREVESLLGCAQTELRSPVATRERWPPGFKLGSYEIVSLLGAGGMGEVYRARDTKLQRDVALKVLPREFQGDPARLARLEREAQVLASLNHPHIAAIYGLEESDGVRFLVLELVEGATLAERIAQGPLPPDEALAAATQIAEALEYAHGKNIVHRDLKPANIKLPGNNVKVLDFGLAKALADPTPGDSLNSPAETMGGTVAGMILGTPDYMSPEQVQGKSLDKGTDIWSFGVVLYEMLTGRPPFRSETVAETMAGILKEPVGLDRIPAKIRPLVKKCLEKDRRRRLRDIGDAMTLVEVANPLEGAGPRHSRLGWLVAAVSTAALLALCFFYLRKPSAEPRPLKLSILPPENTTFFTDPPSISPDGRHIVFKALTGGQAQLWVRDLDSLSSRPLPGTDGGGRPFWSPDSRTVGFLAGGRLKKVDLAGGPVTTLTEIQRNLFGAWSKDDVILFTPFDRIFRVASAGGMPTPVTDLDRKSESAHIVDSFLPDGRHFVYTAEGSGATFIGDMNSKARRQIFPSRIPAVPVIYAPPGYLLFVQDETLMAQPFDLRKTEATAEAIPIVESVAQLRALGPGLFSVSQTGVLAYFSSSLLNNAQLTWFDRSGNPVGTVSTPGVIRMPAISPDGMTVAILRQDPHRVDLWLHDIGHRSDSRLTFGPSLDQSGRYAVWSPDGNHLAFQSSRQIYQQSTKASGQYEPLDVDARVKDLDDWSRDSRYLIEQSPPDPKTGIDVWVLPLFGDRKAFPYLHNESNESQAKLSPDGQWLAYVSDESKRPEVYLVTFPKLEGKWRVSTGGGDRPVWSRDGRELYFVSADQKMMAVAIRPGIKFDYGAPQPLFPVHIAPTASFDVAKDGRFLIPVPVQDGVPSPLNVIVNWTALLKR